MKVSGMEAKLMSEFQVEKGNFVTAGEASASIKRMLKRLGVSASVLRRVAVAAYEVELNLIIHSLGGILSLLADDEQVYIVSQDEGPGIPDIQMAMTEGYSTAPEDVRNLGFGAGMGLPNMKRNADEFFIDSAPGRGTIIRMAFRLDG